MSFFHELWSWIFCEVKWFIFKMIKYCKVYIENQIFDMISLKKVRWFDITKILRKDLIYFFFDIRMEIHSTSYKYLLLGFAYEKYAATRKKERPFFSVKILGEGNN